MRFSLPFHPSYHRRLTIAATLMPGVSECYPGAVRDPTEAGLGPGAGPGGRDRCGAGALREFKFSLRPPLMALSLPPGVWSGEAPRLRVGSSALLRRAPLRCHRL